ncbi:hypothetical protein Nepgr_025596 [Nepenthes gracilis]|uniref:Uncharacterized protein n=1 Tax=Nepenthes gracilis TaxID=150966 RepID=A0AAD3T6M0_NEPGR|nr:hypothetical protein Nepgr_025596 [Nepenthes gracilis]
MIAGDRVQSPSKCFIKHGRERTKTYRFSIVDLVLRNKEAACRDCRLVPRLMGTIPCLDIPLERGMRASSQSKKLAPRA